MNIDFTQLVIDAKRRNMGRVKPHVFQYAGLWYKLHRSFITITRVEESKP